MQNHIVTYLDQSAFRHPDKTAFASLEESLSFSQLKEASEQIATSLITLGASREAVIICMSKQPREIAAFMGVVRAGCFYVPADEYIPAFRLSSMIKTVKARFLICDRKTYEISCQQSDTLTVILYEDLKTQTNPLIEAEYIRRMEAAIDTDPVYVMFTSGSTGVPKGVTACHRSVVDYTEHLAEVMKWDENTIFGNQTPFYFDASMKEIYGTLKTGATTIIIPKSLFSFPIKLIEFMNEYHINTICWVVSALNMISTFKTFDSKKPEYLHTVGFGGEVFPVKQFNRWKEALPGARFVNLYGPTEATGVCCYYEANRFFEEGETIPIGYPFRNTSVLVLDDNDCEASEGELCIRGTSVTMGYFGDVKKTDEVFIQNPLNPYFRDIIYRTGDLVRYNDAHELVFVSRKDRQVKHMGHRIELGEIENTACFMEGVERTACLVIKQNIRLWYTGTVTETEVSEFLRERLPSYMIPNRIRKTQQLPLNANGKTDYAKLYDTE